MAARFPDDKIVEDDALAAIANRARAELAAGGVVPIAWDLAVASLGRDEQRRSERASVGEQPNFEAPG